MTTPPAPRLVAVFLALLVAGLALTIVVADDDGDGRPGSVTIRVDGRDRDTVRDERIVLSPNAVKALEAAQAMPAEAVPEGELDAITLREADDTDPEGVLEGPLAAQDFPGCRTAFVRNYSSRHGASVRIIVWHYTVSAERGEASQNALTAYANNPRNGVSWHFLIGRSGGRCSYNVPLTQKAWTQGNANPFSVGIEVEATGQEGAYVTGAGERKLLAVTREVGRRFDIPMRRGRVVDCRPVTSGIVTHADLGACGGGHHDIGPFTDAPRLVAALAPPQVTGTDRETCRRLNVYRRDVRAGRKVSAHRRQVNVRRRKALEGRRLTCTAKGPVRR